jgi:hypothetical protein
VTHSLPAGTDQPGLSLAGPALARGATITMQAATFGCATVNQAGRDLHVTTGE